MKKKFILFIVLTIIPTTSFCMKKNEEKQNTKTVKYLDKTQCEEVFKKGLEYYGQEEYDKAFEKIKMAADNDNLEAQFVLATMLFEGKGCEKNLSKAMNYCSLAFNGGKKEAETLWFKIVTEFVKKFGKPNNQMPFVLDPSMFGQDGGDDDEEDSPKNQKDKKKDESWRSMYS